MVTSPTRIAVTGTHSTGKTTFLRRLEMELRATGRTVARTPASFAQKAAELGFPKLQNQTPECTEWIIAASAAAAAEATLNADVVLIDRSALDPVAYYLAAQERAGVEPDPDTTTHLINLVKAHTGGYDTLIATVLDPGIPLGDCRDRDLEYRAAVDRHIHALLTDQQIPHQRITGPDDERAILAALTRAESAA
ncbi:ATP-binding protein [Streptomyces sp. APSN-46.1]|uniref:AAA family ATPase n=1 Tax=Streptomyces sp. APSN-46.1 TaxID=2929049 RepID=UPI001FB1DD53|nr:AAA family ATPase [Streptomyces sp. APSN-46.1]MCJ1677052.1 ATP-binding protein [Streptomyces sp. APSN-46.1]